MDWCAISINFVATIIGVFLGFQLENIRIKIFDNREKQKQRKKLNNLLSRLSTSIDENQKSLQDLADVINRNENNVKMVFPIDVSTWDEIKSDINKNLENLPLLHDITHYFLILTNIIKLEDKYFEFASKIVPNVAAPQQTRWAELFEATKKNLNDYIPELLAKTAKIQKDIMAAKMILE